MRGLAVLALMAAPSPVLAQRTELALLGGYTTSGDIERKAVGVEQLKVDGSFTWGVEAGRFFSDRLGVEVSWAQQQSALVLGTRSGSAELFDMTVGLLHGSVVYQLGGAEERLKPFVLAGAGATFLSADDLDGETKLSWTLGAGLKWFPASSVGARLQARYAPTVLDDSSSAFCDPFGFCQGWLHQFELMGGLVLRF